MVPYVMWRLVEHRAPELLVTGVTRYPQMSQSPAPLSCFPRCRADTGLPPDLGHAGPQLVTERAVFRLVIEHSYGHKMIMPGLAIFSRA